MGWCADVVHYRSTNVCPTFLLQQCSAISTGYPRLEATLPLFERQPTSRISLNILFSDAQILKIRRKTASGISAGTMSYWGTSIFKWAPYLIFYEYIFSLLWIETYQLCWLKVTFVGADLLPPFDTRLVNFDPLHFMFSRRSSTPCNSRVSFHSKFSCNSTSALFMIVIRES